MIDDDKEATIRNLQARCLRLGRMVGRLEAENGKLRQLRDSDIIGDSKLLVRELRAENERLRADVRARVPDKEAYRVAIENAKAWAERETLRELRSAAAAEIERLRAVILRYLEFAKDVGVSPVAPELRPIREAMRAAIADGQPR